MLDPEPRQQPPRLTHRYDALKRELVTRALTRPELVRIIRAHPGESTA